ncbi:hypothetical protein GCM10028833_29730 [Glycomyces tarimensis]
MRSASALEIVSPLTGDTGVSASAVTRTMIVFLPDWFSVGSGSGRAAINPVPTLNMPSRCSRAVTTTLPARKGFGSLSLSEELHHGSRQI